MLGFHPQLSVTTIRPRFSGEAEYQNYRQRLARFSDSSIQGVAQILKAGRHHVGIAKSLGKNDTDIDWMNDEVEKLIRQRHDNRNSDPASGAQGQEHLDDFRRAIRDVMHERGYDEKGNRLLAFA